MFGFILRRLIASLGVLLVVTVLAFVLFQYVGDPVNQMLGVEATEADRQRLRAELGLDDSVPSQFARYVANLAQGELGNSLRQGRPVADMFRERLPATLELSLLSGVVALLVGVVLGVSAAIRPNALRAKVAMLFSLIGATLPSFLIGILLIVGFSVQLNWLPSFGRGPTELVGGWSTGLLSARGWMHLIMPVATLCLFQLALIVRLSRTEMLEVLKSDYVKFARARGIPEHRIRYGHALRNAMIPVITVAGLQLGTVIAFALVTETVFQWPGVGLLFVESLAFADVPVLAAYLCFVSLTYVGINLLVDLAYVGIDPRLRVSGS